jgi:hypothetical protein
MSDPMPIDPFTDWAKMMGIARLELPDRPGDPGRWWMGHVIATAQNIELPADVDDVVWLSAELAHDASEATNWLAIFASLAPILDDEEEQDQLELICKGALQTIASRLVEHIFVERRKS